MFLLFFPCTRICKLCPDYEVVMFQPCIGTPLNLGSVSNCYLAIILKPAPPFFTSTWCPPWWGYRSCPTHIFLANRRVSTQDHSTTRASTLSVPEYQGPLIPATDSATSLTPFPYPHLLEFHCSYYYVCLLFIILSVAPLSHNHVRPATVITLCFLPHRRLTFITGRGYLFPLEKLNY